MTPLVQVLSAAEAVAAVQELEVREFPDWYWNPRYASLAEHHDAGRWHVAIAESGPPFWYPFVVREVSPSCLDAISPYGYGGVICLDGTTPSHADFADFRATVDATLAGMGVVSEFVRLHPLFAETLTDSATESGVTYSIDLTQPHEERFARSEGRHRTAVRKCRKEGLTVVSMPPESLAHHASAFRRLYAQTMDRLGARSAYRYDDRYFEALVDGFRADTELLEVVDADGKVHAAALFVCSGSLAQYHLSCADRSMGQSGATNLLLDEASNVLARRGVSRLHLGGGRVGSDGLTKFKSSLGSEAHTFYVDRRIHDSARYDELVAAAFPDGPAPTEYFPAYRHPAGARS